MSIVKKTKEYTITKRRDGRYAVTGAKKAPINGDEKVAILQQEGLLAKPEPKAEAPVEATETSEDAE